MTERGAGRRREEGRAGVGRVVRGGGVRQLCENDRDGVFPGGGGGGQDRECACVCVCVCVCVCCMCVVGGGGQEGIRAGEWGGID